MKKYKKRTPLFPTNIMVTATIIVAITTFIVLLIQGEDSDWFFICSVLLFSTFFLLLLNILATSHGYVYENDSIRTQYLSLSLRKIDYNRIKIIIISDAIYNTTKHIGTLDYSSGTYIKNEFGKRVFIQYPYITLHGSFNILKKIKSGMNSREVLWCDKEDTICLGICWFDALSELLSHTTSKIYILQDVYERFQGNFDAVLWLDKSYEERTYIVNDHPIAYQDYVADYQQNEIG